jgi:hypothetical protein
VETAFVSLICIVLLVVGGMTMSHGFLTSLDQTAANINVISERNQDMMRTNILINRANQIDPDNLYVSLANCGQTKLNEYDKWDIMVRYFDSSGQSHAAWLPFYRVVGQLGDNQWGLEGIYLDPGGSTPEVFNPGILDPEENMIFKCKLNPGIGPNTINLVSVATPNGVTVSKSFQGYTP